MADAPDHLLYLVQENKPEGQQMAAYFRQAVRTALGAPQAPHIPASNPVSMDRDNIKMLGQEDYMVSLKADGVRYFLVITMYKNQRLAGMVSRAGTVYIVMVNAQRRLYTDTHVFDGELCECRTDTTAYDYLAFDALMLKGCPIHDRPYKERLAQVRLMFGSGPLTAKMRRQNLQLITPEAPALDFMIKPAEPAERLRGFVKRETPRFRTDGFIFTPCNRPLWRGRDVHTLKLKEKNTIDVRLVVESQDLKEARIYILRDTRDVSIRDALADEFDEVYIDSAATGIGQASDIFQSILRGSRVYDSIFMQDQSINFDEIVEVDCRIEGHNKRRLRLTFSRLRQDKDSPNEVTTVQKTLGSIRDDIKLDEACCILEKRASGKR